MLTVEFVEAPDSSLSAIQLYRRRQSVIEAKPHCAVSSCRWRPLIVHNLTILACSGSDEEDE